MFGDGFIYQQKYRKKNKNKFAAIEQHNQKLTVGIRRVRSGKYYFHLGRTAPKSGFIFYHDAGIISLKKDADKNIGESNSKSGFGH